MNTPSEQHEREVLPRIPGAKVQGISDCGHLMPVGRSAGAFVTLHVIGGWTQREEGFLHGFGRDVNWKEFLCLVPYS